MSKGIKTTFLEKPKDIQEMDLFTYREREKIDTGLGKLNESGWCILNSDGTTSWISCKQFDLIELWKAWARQ